MEKPAEEKNSKTRKKALNSPKGDGKMKRWEEQRKGVVKSCFTGGKTSFSEVEAEGTIQVKHTG